MNILNKGFGENFIIITGLIFFPLSCTNETPDEKITISAEQALTIAKEAYIYALPMVLNYKSLYQYTIDEQHPEYKGQFNEVSCEARLFTPDDKAVVTPNADTPYCMLWMDLRAEPLVLIVPEMDADRYYSFQLIDIFTHNFAYVGNLSTGSGAGRYLLAGPDWSGDKPQGITDIIRSETNLIFSIGRTQLYDSADLPKVKEILNNYVIQPLSEFQNSTKPAAAPIPDFPMWVEGSQFDERSLYYLDFLLTFLEKPLEVEKEIWQRMKLLGLGPDNNYNYDDFSPEIQDAIKAGIKDATAEMQQFIASVGSDPLASAKIFGTRDFLEKSAVENFGHKNHYLIRAVAAHIGLYGNSAFEAIYPAYLADTDGSPFDASSASYKLSFAKDSFPPVKSFWSLTIYDGKTQLFIDNPLDRYLLNSTMMERFHRENDGSVILHIAKNSPGKELVANWLPAPDGPFYMVLRLYGPEAKALEGKWTPPVLQKID